MAIVKTDSKTKLKALELFIRFQERKRHRAEMRNRKPSDPLSNIPTIQKAYDTATKNVRIGRLTGQAMPNIAEGHGVNVPCRHEMLCGVDLEPGVQIRRIYTVQTNGDCEILATYPEPRTITNTAKSYGPMSRSGA